MSNNQFIMIKKNKIIEIMLIIYFTVMSLDFFTSNYIDAVVLTIINLFVIIKTAFSDNKYEVNKYTIMTYIVLIFNLTLIILSILKTTNDYNLILMRIMRLSSFIQLYFLFSIEKGFIDYKYILLNVIKSYYYIAIIILIDSFSYKILGISLWPPEDYVGLRYSGPFQDSNYISIYYAINLILVTYINLDISKKYKIKYIISFIIMMFLGKSWSAIILLGFSIISTKFIKIKTVFLKAVAIGCSYIIFIYILSEKLIEFRNFVVNLMINIGISPIVAAEKFYSLEKRFHVQIGVIRKLQSNPWGLGVRGIISQFNLDTHNSYISAIGDLGIFGLIIIFITMFIKIKKYTRISDILSSYLLLQCIFVDLFFTQAYWLVIFIIFLVNSDKKLSRSN